MIKSWADATCGMMGRSGDFLNSMITAWAAKKDYFAQQSPENGERVWRYALNRPLAQNEKSTAP